MGYEYKTNAPVDSGPLQFVASPVSDHDPTKNRAGFAFLLALTLVALYFCYVLVAPFLQSIVSAVVMAILFHPVHVRIRRHVRSRDLAALLSTTLVVVTVVLTTLFLGKALAAGWRDVYDSLRSTGNGGERLGLYLVELLDWAVALVGRYLPISTSDLRSATVNQAERGISLLFNMTAGALGGATKLIANALIAFFILFFLLRDGRAMLRRAVVLLPLQTDQTRRLLARIKETLNAIVFGTLAVAAMQGALTGLAFWFLGVSSPGLWAIVTALCALLPVVGTTIVLLPAVSMLTFSGHWIKGLFLLLWGLAVVHPIDNVLRPLLIGGHTRLSTLYVFFALLGGLRAFGAMGVFVGPIVLAITLALLQFLREEKKRKLAEGVT